MQEIHLPTIKHTQFEGVGKALSQSPRVSSYLVLPSVAWACLVWVFFFQLE